MPRILLTLILFLPFYLSGQNLIRNADFEQKNGCPSGPGQINLANYWYSPNGATPDYFNDCATSMNYGTEFNKKGGQIAHSGKAYAGLQFYSMNRNDYYEYLETRLDSALLPNRLYCITAFISLGQATYALDELGAVLSVNEVRSGSNSKMKLPYTQLVSGESLTDQDQWMCIRGIVKAKGGERFITVGDFSKKDNFRNIRTGMSTDSLFKSTYYFIDAVSLESISDSNQCSCNPSPH